MALENWSLDKKDTAAALFRARCMIVDPDGKGKYRLSVHERHPDAPLSPYYFNIRSIRRFGDERHWVAFYLWQTFLREREDAFDVLADVPTAVTPLVTELDVLVGKGFISPHPKKGYGTESTIDAPYQTGERVVLIDDTLTSGRSLLTHASILEEAGLAVPLMIVVAERMHGGRHVVEKAGYMLFSAFTIRELLDYGLAEELLTLQQHEASCAYDPLLERYLRERQ